MSPTPIVLILGAGPRIGVSVAEKFSTLGYKVALASRKGTNTQTSDGFFSLCADFANPATVPSLFESVKRHFQAAPSVVVYNAASLTPPSDKDSVLSVPTERVAADLNVNVVSAYVAAQEAVKAWDEEGLGGGRKKCFIYTGNILNERVLNVPMMLDLGMGKAASAYWVGVASGLYADKGYKFYYADERHADGNLKGMELDGPAHADFYAELAKQADNVPWLATFVKGKGYVGFK